MKGAMLLMAILFLAAGVIFTGSGAAQVTVRVGDLGIADDAPFYIGLEKGYFREKGIHPLPL